MKSSLALKYRPKRLNEIVGQESVVQTLVNAHKKKKLNHAYLFVGIFGTGKTTIARIVAAMENCLENSEYPCGKCDICSKVFEGKHVDIEEIDAAGKFAKVEEARKLKDNARYRPVDQAKVKYYIIDEAHRMSEAANDSLLKILEEPPEHVRFILCTTDVNKMRPAIQSRCQRHDFNKIYWRQIKDQLSMVSKQEKINIEEAALNMCAKMAQGSMRSALFNLEKLIDFAGDESITAEHGQKLFGTPSDLLYYDLLDEAIGVSDGKPDASKAFRIINNMLSSGAKFETIYSDVADHLRNLMVGLSCGDAGEFLSVSESQRERLLKQLTKIKEKGKLNSVLISLNKLHEARKAFEYNLSAETVLQQWFLEALFSFRAK